MKTELSHVCAALAIPETPPDWPAAWQAFSAAPPNPAFSIEQQTLDESLSFCSFSTDVAEAIRASAAQARANPTLAAMTAFLFHLFFADPPPTYATLGTWPFVSRTLPTPAAMLPALMLAAGIPKLRLVHAARGIPEAITRDTTSDLEVWMRTFQRQTGYHGLMNLRWLANHWQARLYRIGRLQFIQGRFPDKVRVFEEKASKRILAFAEPGETQFRCDGLVNGTNDIYDPEAWLPTLNITEQAITGHPVDPSGFVLPRAISLPAGEWRQVLAPNDPMLDIHIPEGGPMDFEACGLAMEQARAFFAKHFPDKPKPLAFYCGTWFFDSQLKAILPASSNIVRFQREFYLYPMFSTDAETFRRVFGGKPADFASAPRDTSLRRAILDFTLAGNRLRCASGFRLINSQPWGSA